jgi:iron complex outermembrane receptor protein
MLDKLCLLLLLLLLLPGAVFADDDETDSDTETIHLEDTVVPENNETGQASDDGKTDRDAEAIQLDDIVVEERKENENNRASQFITKEEIEMKGSENLWEIMGTLPGVILTGGGERNESNFRLRGFDAKRVPIYIDGVSQAIPYRGDADHARILTFDIESIEIQKGYSSMLMGANNLGGLISLTTAKPREPLEGSLRYDTEFDNILEKQKSMYQASIGSRRDHFYAKVGGAYIDQSHFRLPDSFRPRNDYQSDWEREDSYEKDAKATLMAGITPTDNSEAYITYVCQRAEKSAPGSISAEDPKIWDWTKWNRDSVALNARYDTNRYYAKFLAYYDKFDNRLYTTDPHEIPSDYDDYSFGTKIQGGIDLNSWNNLQASLMWKTESHRGWGDVTDMYSKNLEIEEYTYSFGAEYSTTPWNPVNIVFGAGYDALIPQAYWTASRGSEAFESTDELDGFVYQVGVFYDVTENHELHFTYSKKTHFPTMTERFAARYDTVIPNPALQPEYAFHYEIGYKGVINEKARINTSIYFSDFRDKILQELVKDAVTGEVITHSVNKDKWNYYGFELQGEFHINKHLQINTAFSYNKSDNQFDTDVRDAYYPEITGNALMLIKPTEDVSLVSQYEYVAERYTSSSTDDDSKLDSYYLLHFTARVNNIWKNFYAEFKINNMLDKYYEIQEDYPMAGRTFSFAVGSKF